MARRRRVRRRDGATRKVIDAVKADRPRSAANSFVSGQGEVAGRATDAACEETTRTSLYGNG